MEDLNGIELKKRTTFIPEEAVDVDTGQILKLYSKKEEQYLVTNDRFSRTYHATAHELIYSLKSAVAIKLFMWFSEHYGDNKDIIWVIDTKRKASEKFKVSVQAIESAVKELILEKAIIHDRGNTYKLNQLYASTLSSEDRKTVIQQYNIVINGGTTNFLNK